MYPPPPPPLSPLVRPTHLLLYMAHPARNLATALPNSMSPEMEIPWQLQPPKMAALMPHEAAVFLVPSPWQVPLASAPPSPASVDPHPIPVPSLGLKPALPLPGPHLTPTPILRPADLHHHWCPWRPWLVCGLSGVPRLPQTSAPPAPSGGGPVPPAPAPATAATRWGHTVWGGR